MSEARAAYAKLHANGSQHGLRENSKRARAGDGEEEEEEEDEGAERSKRVQAGAFTPEQTAAAREAIANATSLDDVNRLQRALRTFDWPTVEAELKRQGQPDGERMHED